MKFTCKILNYKTELSFISIISIHININILSLLVDYSFFSCYTCIIKKNVYNYYNFFSSLNVTWSLKLNSILLFCLFFLFKYPIIDALIFHLSHKSVPTFLLVLVINNDMGIYPISMSKINLTSIKCRLKYLRIEKKSTQILIYFR